MLLMLLLWIHQRRSAQTRAAVKFITDVIPNVLGTWNANLGKPDYLDASKKI